MTLPRAFAITCMIFATIPQLTGQSASGPVNKSRLTLEQGSLAESLAADSALSALVVPNVFTPNDDEINDYFEVETDGVTVYKFMVFTRTGNRVFRSTSPRIFWDGRSNNGLPMKEGVYYYVIEAEGEPSTEKAGFIYLYR